jgi:hypothetical protein
VGKFRVTSPDGQKYDITAPEGATDDDVLKYAQSQFGSSQLPPQPQASLGDVFWGTPLGQLLVGGSDVVGGPYKAGSKLGSYISGLYGGEKTGAPPLPFVSDIEAAGERGRAVTGRSGLSRGVGGFVAGGGLPLVGSALKLGYRLVEPFTKQGLEQIVGRVLNKAAGATAPETAQALAPSGAPAIGPVMPPPTTVPGSFPIAGEAATGTAGAEFAGLQRELAKTQPTPYLARDEAQREARQKAIQQVGKTPQELESAIGTRGAEAKRAYGAVERDFVESDKPLEYLLSRPATKSVLGRAAALTKDQGYPFKIGETVPAHRGPTGVVEPENWASYTVQGLHNIKMAMDDTIKNPERFGIGASEAAAMAKIRDRLIGWIEAKSPGYALAREGFRVASGPINKMQAGQYLEGKLVAPLAEGTEEVAPLAASERAGQYAQALRDVPGTLKKSTGMARFTKLSDVFDSNEIKSIQAVGTELQRRAQYTRTAAAGAPAARQLIEDELAYVQLPHILKRAIVVLNYSLGIAKEHAKGRAADLAAKVMQDPAETARLMNNVGPQQQVQALEALRQIAQVAGTWNATVPGQQLPPQAPKWADFLSSLSESRPGESLLNQPVP